MPLTGLSVAIGRTGRIRSGRPFAATRLVPAASGRKLSATPMRLSVDSRTAEFISSRAAGFRHPISRIEELAIDLGVLPLWVDWTVFLAVGSDGRVLMVDHEAAEPNLRPANDLTFVAIALVEGAARYPELASFLPVRPPGRGPCTTCGGAGTLSMSRGSVVLHCICGGLGWKPETPAELGLVGESA